MPPRKSRYDSRRRHSGPTRAAPSPEVPQLLVVRHRRFSDSDGPERVRQFPDDASPGSTRRKRNGRKLPSSTGRGDVWQSTGTGTGPAPRRRQYPSCGYPETIPTTAPKKIVPPACRTAPDSFAGASGSFSDLCDHAVSDTPPPSDSATDTPSPVATQARYGTVRQHRRRLPKCPHTRTARDIADTSRSTPHEATRRHCRHPSKHPHTGQPDDTADDSRNTDRNSVQLPPVALSVRINLFSTPRRPYLSHRNRQSTSERTVPPHPAGRNLRQRTKHRYGQPILPFSLPSYRSEKIVRKASVFFGHQHRYAGKPSRPADTCRPRNRKVGSHLPRPGSITELSTSRRSKCTKRSTKRR